jgi:hypothetical protein
MNLMKLTSLDPYGNAAVRENKETRASSGPIYGNLNTSRPQRQEFDEPDVNAGCKQTPISIKRRQQSPMQPVCEQPVTEKLEGSRF